MPSDSSAIKPTRYRMKHQDQKHSPSTKPSSVQSSQNSVGSAERSSRLESWNPIHVDVGIIGRDEERRMLEQAYSRVCCLVQQANSEIVWVEGEAGSGKSTLVNSLRQSIEREDMGLMVQGKFDQNATRPYSAIVDAAKELCQLVVASEYVVDIKEALQQEFSEEDMQLLVNLFPAIQSIVDVKPSSTVEETHEYSLKRFLQVLGAFWKAVASVHPVILFLDDLQWADHASRQLLTVMAKDLLSVNLLLVGSSRQGEFRWEFQDSESTLRLTHITLHPLGEESVNELVSRVIQLTPQETEELGAVVHRKTGGNVYFVWQYLEMLYTESLLIFSYRTNRWEWESDIDARTNVSDNLVEILTQKMTKLPPRTQIVLLLAACLGHTFDPNVLESVILSENLLSCQEGPEDCKLDEETGRTEFQRALDDAMRAGLIEKSGSRYKFSHDRVQQLAFNIDPKGVHREMLYSILGRRVLVLSRTEKDEDWMIFTAVDLLTKYTTHEEASEWSRVELACLCLETSRKALTQSSFIAAASYADRGYSLLEPTERWNRHYSLCLELCTLSAEMHTAYGNYCEAKRYIKVVTTNAKKLEEKFAVHNMRVAALMAHQDQSGAINMCRALLNELGVKLPLHALKLHLIQNLIVVKRLLKGRKPKDLDNLITMHNPEMLQACRLLNYITLIAFTTEHNDLFILACLTLLRITLSEGISQYSPYAFAAYGAVLSHLGQFREAYEYGVLALESQAKYGTKETIARTYLAVFSVLHHLREPIFCGLEPALRASDAGIRVGDVQYVGHCLAMRCFIGLQAGMRLDHLETQIRGYTKVIRDYKVESALIFIEPLHQVILNLLGHAQDPLILTGEVMDEAVFVKQQTGLKNTLALLFLHRIRLVLLVTLDEFDEADRERRSARRLCAEPSTHWMKVFNYFFCALVCLGMARKSKHRRAYYLRKARKLRSILDRFARCGSVNCVPFVHLLDAQLLSSSFESRKSGASKEIQCVVSKYNDAINAASRCGFRLCKGIAFEKAGEFLLNQGETVLGVDYLQRAWTEFSDYGAYGKISQMERKYLGVCDFQDDSALSGSRPSVFTRPHAITTKFHR